VYGANYQLAEYSLHKENQFTSVVFWNGKPYIYDGMNPQGKLIRIMKDGFQKELWDPMHTF